MDDTDVEKNQVSLADTLNLRKDQALALSLRLHVDQCTDELYSKEYAIRNNNAPIAATEQIIMMRESHRLERSDTIDLTAIEFLGKRQIIKGSQATSDIQGIVYIYGIAPRRYTTSCKSIIGSNDGTTYVFVYKKKDSSWDQDIVDRNYGCDTHVQNLVDLSLMIWLKGTSSVIVPSKLVHKGSSLVMTVT